MVNINWVGEEKVGRGRKERGVVLLYASVVVVLIALYKLASFSPAISVIYCFQPRGPEQLHSSWHMQGYQ